MPGLCASVSWPVLLKLLIQMPSHPAPLLFLRTPLHTFPYLLTSVLPRPSPGFFPPSWLHGPLVHVLILKAFCVSLACFFKDQGKFKVIFPENQKHFGNNGKQWWAFLCCPQCFLWVRPSTLTKEKLWKVTDAEGNSHTLHISTVNCVSSMKQKPAFKK